MVKPNTNKTRESFIVMTGAIVMAIIVYMGFSEIKSFSASENFAPITNGINAIEDTLKGNLNMSEPIDLSSREVEKNSIGEKAIILIK